MSKAVTELRFKVCDYIGNGLIVARIPGLRTKLQVRVTRTKATGYSAIIPVADWDKWPRSADEARAEALRKAMRSVEIARDKLQMLEEELVKVINEHKKYPVKDIR